MHLAGPHDGPQGAGCARICRHHVTSSGRVRLPSRAISGAADDIRCPIAFLPQKLFETGRSHREAADKELANSRLCSRLMHEVKVAEMKKVAFGSDVQVPDLKVVLCRAKVVGRTFDQVWQGCV